MTEKTIDRDNMSSVSSTQRTMNRLIETGIVEKINNKFSFSDLFYKRFLQLHFGA